MECPECGKNFYGMQMMIQNVSVIFAASLICDFCPSDQSFAYSFLQIPSHDGHPYCSAIHFPLSGCVRDFHPLECAHGVQTTKRTGKLPRSFIPSEHFQYFILYILLRNQQRLNSFSLYCHLFPSHLLSSSNNAFHLFQNYLF